MVSSQFISPEEQLANINSSAAELHEELMIKFGDSYAISEATLQLSTGDELTLPTDFFKLLTLDVLIGNRYRKVDRWVINERDRYTSSQSPSPGTFRLWYIPRYLNAGSLSEALPDHLELNNFSEYIVVDCCIKALTKEESDAGIFIMQKQALLERISKHAQNRDAGQTEFLADMEGWSDPIETYPYSIDSNGAGKIRYKLHGNKIKLISLRGAV